MLGEGAFQKWTSAADGARESLPGWGTSTSVPSRAHLTALAWRAARARGPGTGPASAAQVSDLCHGLATFLILQKPCLFELLHVHRPGPWGPPADALLCPYHPGAPGVLCTRLPFPPLQGCWSVWGRGPFSLVLAASGPHGPCSPGPRGLWAFCF